MSGMTSFDLDDTGKIDLNAIYDQPDPRAYYQTLVKLKYQIPAVAAPLFRSIIDVRRSRRRQQKTTILDVGSSYGVNSAILRHGIDLADLFHLYSGGLTGKLSRSELIARDRKLFSEVRTDRALSAVGLDVAGEALGYAEEVGIIDGGITANFEEKPVSAEDRELLEPTDIVISTGAIGYVGVPTFSKILDCTGAAPWFALFALRMFPVGEIAAMFKHRGYSMFRLPGRTFRQRRFAGKDEAREVLARLQAMGIDAADLEEDGWYHAEFYFAWRDDEAGLLPIAGLVPTGPRQTS